MNDIKVTMLCWDRKVTDMMRGFDLFESWKVVFKDAVTGTGKLAAGETPETVCGKLCRGLQLTDHPPIAVWVVGETTHAWRDPQLRAVSDGKDWAPIDHFLKQHGYPEVA